MAAAASQVKQLGEILKEQQEPFILQTYLIEKGCFNGKQNKEQVSLGCFNGKKHSSRKKGIHKLVRILIGSINKRGKSSEKTLQAERLSSFDSSCSTALDWGSGDEEENREICSSSSSSGNKCSYLDLQFCNPNDQKINGVGLQLQYCMEDENQQFSPDSVLDGFTSTTHEEASSPANNKIRDVSNSSYEVILHKRSISRVEVSQQLLLDCIAEVVEMAHGSCSRKKLWGTSERILRSWSGRKGKPFHNLELCDQGIIIDKWSDDEQRREIGLEIEDLIFQEIMVDLIGVEIINLAVEST